tara:strand:- start:1022 stop:1933 length:912 start_codon:yes stop_codon:yes gene_type:complete
LKKSRILIAGGTGFIGYHLAKKCLKLNWSVDSISTKLPRAKRKLKKVKYFKLDISNRKSLTKNILKDYDYVVNLAGYVDHSDKKKTIDSHFDGCRNLATFFLNKNIKRFIQVGSSIEYGKIKSPQKENKKNSQKTYSFYGKAKLLSTKFLLKLKKKHNFPATILRLYLVYGPYQDVNRIIPFTIMNAINDVKFDCSSGNQLRDFIYIEDLVIAIIKIIKNENLNGEIINIGSGKPLSIKKLIIKICKLSKGGKPQFGKIPFRKDEILKLYPNLSKIKKVIKWETKVNLDQGLKKTIKYFKKLS